MAKVKTNKQENVEEPLQGDVALNTTQQESTSSEESDETIVDEVSEKVSAVNENEGPLVKTDEAIANIDVVETADAVGVEDNYEQIDFEEDVEFNEEVGKDTEIPSLGGPVTESKYSFSEKALDDYLESDKQDDRIVQESKFGNFVSNRTHEIYVPLSLFLK